MKTIVSSFLALCCGCGFAASLDSPVWTLDTQSLPTESTWNLTGTPSATGNFTMAGTLDVGICSRMTAGQPIAGAAFTLFSLASDTHKIGAATGYSSNSSIIRTAGIYTTISADAVVGTDAVPVGYRSSSCTGTGINSLADITWDNVDKVAFTYSHNNTAGTTINFTIRNNDGSTFTYLTTDSGLKWSTGFGDWNTLIVNTDVVKSAYLMDGSVTNDEAVAMNQRLLVPEPSAAAMSLLAFAGLAARRRRK